MAKIQYEADGPVSAERFIAALTDFSPRRPELWPNLDAKYFRLHELGDTWADATEGSEFLGGVWARERYDWSEPGIVRLRLVEAVDFRPGTEIVYRVVGRPGGGCHVVVDFQRIAASLRGRVVGALVQMAGALQFRNDLRVTLERLSAIPSSVAAGGAWGWSAWAGAEHRCALSIGRMSYEPKIRKRPRR